MPTTPRSRSQIKRAAAQGPQITAKCVACKVSAVLTERQLNNARELGMAMCEKCGNPMVITKVKSP
jgi:hypothetical protein